MNKFLKIVALGNLITAFVVLFCFKNIFSFVVSLVVAAMVYKVSKEDEKETKENKDE